MQNRSFCLKHTLYCLLLLTQIHAHSQDVQLKGTQKLYSNKILDNEFKHYQIFELNPAHVQQALLSKGGRGRVSISLAKHEWLLELEPSGVLPEHYTLQVLSDKGLKVYPKQYEKAFKGIELNKGGNVRMTIDTDFLAGLVENGKETWFIEPVRHYDLSAPANFYVFYEQQDALKREYHHACETIHHAEEKGSCMHDFGEHTNMAEARMMICLDLQLAIASDRSMFDKYGSVAAVENHNIAVMNDVQTNFTGAFLHDINFVIVTQFVVTGTDPWTPSTAAGIFLASFRSWANAGGFGSGVIYDLGQIWTNRDFDGSTIGVAYVGGLCTSSRYQALQDFTSNASLLRVMTAHETGHNLNMEHDGSGGFIMSPTVSNTNTWSTLSVNTFASFIPGNINSSCLVPCAGGGGGTPPTAGFSANPSTACVNQSITLTNTSTGNPTSYTWTMPGGTPASSTATNPTVTYATPGVKTITLTATNSNGSNTTTQNVTVISAPTATFTSSTSGLTVSFTYTGTGATSWLWNFGNGQTSTQQNPIHTYATPGTYNVTLQVTGQCGTNQTISNVTTGPLAAFTANVTSGCAPLTVQFTNQSVGATSFSWQFQGGTPSTSTLSNPTVTFNNPGSFDVTLIATNSAGSYNETKFDYIVVQAPPVASFNTSVSGTTVTFTNTSIFGNTYLWNFGDGSTSTQFSPTYTYINEGTYTVTLTVTNSCGSNTTTRTVQVFLPPIVGFAVSQNSGCAPLSVNFTSTSSGTGLTYNWQFPGGNPSSSTQANPTVNYVSPGNYSVTLTVSNAAGSSTAVQSNLIQVQGPPVTDFVVNVVGTTVHFTNLTTGATSYLWNFGNGQTSTVANPTHTYQSQGTYNVVLTSTNACGVSTYTETVVIALPPTAVITASQTSGCAPTSVQFTGISTPGVNHQWTFAGGTPATSTAANPTVTYTNPGTYQVVYTVSNAAGSSSATQTINMGAGATPVFTASTNGLTATFTNNSSNATSYSWDFGDGNNSSAASPTHTYAQDGIYTVVLSATNACGTNTASQTVVIVTPPTAAFTANNTNGCTPMTVQFTNQSSANANVYAWNFGNGTPISNVQNPSITYTAAGVYTVTLTVSNAAGTSTATSTITVGTGANPSFTTQVNQAVVQFQNSSSGANSYLWAFGDGNTSTATQPVHTYANDGTYTVTLTAFNACGGSTVTQTVVIVTPPTAGFGAASTSGCAPFTTTFSNQSSANATSFEWTFAGGTPATSTEANPVVTYSTPGTYTVTLRAVNSAGFSTETKTNYIVSVPGPTAAMTASTNLATLSTQNNSINANTWLWSFGDGNTSTQQAPIHTYTQDGTYTVILTASSACGSSTASQTVTVITPPSANFTASSTSGCLPLTVAFSNQSTANATSYQWTFAGGNPATSTDANPIVVYSAPGTYTVVLTASNSAGSNTETKTNYVSVTTGPAAAFTATTNGLSATFNNTSQGATSVLWNFGDGNTGTNFNPTHTYATDGVYTVTLTAQNACGSNTTTQTVNIVTQPTAAFTMSAASGCAPHTVTMNNGSSANATSFQWTFAGGSPATSTDANPSVTWNTPGTYTVTLVAGNAAGQSTSTQSVVVTTVPQTAFTAVTGGLEVALTNQTQGALSYLWAFGDGNTSTETNPTHTYAAPGVYVVTLTSTNACGTSTSVQTITISGSAPVPRYTTSGNMGCAPLTVQYMDNSVGNPTSWLWTFQGGTPATSTEQNPLVVYGNPGSFDITLTVSNVFGQATKSWQNAVMVDLMPIAGFTSSVQNRTVTFTNTSQNSTVYTWDFGDGNTSNALNPIHTYDSDGVYTVTLNASNVCGSSVLQLVVTVLTIRTHMPTWLDKMVLAPNPTDQQFSLWIEAEPAQSMSATLFDMLGRELMRQESDFSTGSAQMDWQVGNLASATYYLRIQRGHQIAVVPVVIRR